MTHPGMLINFFEMVRNDPESLTDRLKYSLASRAMFMRLRATRPENLTPPDRAFRFLYLLKNSFGGYPDAHSFQIRTTNVKTYIPSRLGELVRAAHKRLEKTVLECAGWEKILQRYDKPGTFFYLDPPYYGVEDYYPGANFRRGDFAVLASALGKIRGKFLLSINDRPETKEIFAAFRQERVQTTYTVNRDRSLRAGELLVANYDYQAEPGLMAGLAGHAGHAGPGFKE